MYDYRLAPTSPHKCKLGSCTSTNPFSLDIMQIFRDRRFQTLAGILSRSERCMIDVLTHLDFPISPHATLIIPQTPGWSPIPYRARSHKIRLSVSTYLALAWLTELVMMEGGNIDLLRSWEVVCSKMGRLRGSWHHERRRICTLRFSKR